MWFTCVIVYLFCKQRLQFLLIKETISICIYTSETSKKIGFHQHSDQHKTALLKCQCGKLKWRA